MTQSFLTMTCTRNTTTLTPPMMSERALRWHDGSARTRNCNGHPQSWFTREMLTVLCGWSRSCAAPAELQSTFLFRCSRRESRVTGKDKEWVSGEGETNRRFQRAACRFYDLGLLTSPDFNKIPVL